MSEGFPYAANHPSRVRHHQCADQSLHYVDGAYFDPTIHGGQYQDEVAAATAVMPQRVGINPYMHLAQYGWAPNTNNPAAEQEHQQSMYQHQHDAYLQQQQQYGFDEVGHPTPPQQPMVDLDDTSSWTFFDPLKSDKHPQVFLTVDFETHVSDDWFAVGVMVAEYPSGKVLQKWNTGIPIPLEQFDAKNKKFWKNLSSVKNHLDAENHGDFSLAEKQKQVCQFIRLMHFTYRRLRPISDNPGFDIRLLDNMLDAHDLPVVSARHDHSSAPVLCSYSYGLGVLGTICGQTHDSIESVHSRIFSALKGDLFQQREVDILGGGPKHIPLNDCARTLSMHFKALDIIRFYRLFALRPPLLQSPWFFEQFDLVPHVVQFEYGDAEQQQQQQQKEGADLAAAAEAVASSVGGVGEGGGGGGGGSSE